MKTPRHHILGYFSSYDRGLEYLLYIWPDIREVYPDAELNIAYGWNTFDKLTADNPERQAWKQEMVKLINQEGITHHGRVNKQALKKLNEYCGIWAYPTDFYEINCITALTAQRHGCVPVVMNFDASINETTTHKTALDETVYSGVKVEGDIRTPEGIEAYKKELLSLMDDQKRWQELSRKGKQMSWKYNVTRIAENWSKEISTPTTQPLVTIVTCTIRKGFWNLMAHNIANQSYKNIEWLVVDDFPENREKLMQEACEKHGIVGRYVRGNKTDKFYYALSTANNIGWKNAQGELLVWLQDFVLMPTHGIESLVDIHRHHPNDLIAPIDVYYLPSMEPKIHQEDWFDGNLEVIGEYLRSNVRDQHKGIWTSTNPTDWEANYGAIPKAVIDRLGGWYEFFNDGLGFDNTEIAYRALQTGSKIIVDDTNKAVCLDHWEAIKDDKDQHGELRELRLNDPRYYWMIDMINKGKLPLKRDEKQDTFRLFYEMPKEITKDEAAHWIRDHIKVVTDQWENILWK